MTSNWRRLAPGVYDDGEGAMHIVVSELLVANGWPDTDANRETLIEAAVEMFTTGVEVHE